MNPYQRLLQLTQGQTEAFQRGDVRSMQLLMLERGALLAQLPSPSAAERTLLQHAVQLDRELSTALRERMLALRSAAASAHHTRVNLNGYRVTRAGASTRLLNFAV